MVVRSAIALVTVHSGAVTAEQLVTAFTKMFQWGWEWKARQFAPDSFLVKYPSIKRSLR